MQARGPAAVAIAGTAVLPAAKMAVLQAKVIPSSSLFWPQCQPWTIDRCNHGPSACSGHGWWLGDAPAAGGHDGTKRGHDNQEL